MAGGRSIIALASLFFLAGGILLQIFVVLSGGVSGSPEGKFYFLSADTSSFGGSAHSHSAWTFFAVCGITGSSTHNCGKAKPALPFNPVENFGSSDGVPKGFLGTNKYYYLSRFMFAFYIMALFFAAIGLLMGVLAIFTRLGSYLSGALAFLAMFFQMLAAALMTAWTVEARNVFHKNNLTANLGKYSYGFTWAAVACFFLSTVLFCVGGSVGKSENKRVSKKSRFGAFGGRRSTRSRGSFGDTENGGVKSEYS